MSFNSFNLTASPTTPFNNPSFTPSPYPTHDFIISPPPHGLALGLHNHSSFTTRSPRVLPATEVPNVGRRSKKLKQISLYDIIVDPTVVFGTAYKNYSDWTFHVKPGLWHRGIKLFTCQVHNDNRKRPYHCNTSKRRSTKMLYVNSMSLKPLLSGSLPRPDSSTKQSLKMDCWHLPQGTSQ